MTFEKTTNQTDSIYHQQAEAIEAFTTITTTLQKILKSPPLDRYTTITFIPSPFELNGPRFGVTESINSNSQVILSLSQNLLSQFQNYLIPILWREAYLLHLPSVIRQVEQAADLGLYCYYRYGIKNPKQRHRFLQVWETVSPPIDYPTYRYYPTAGFASFDRVVDGAFLRKAKRWFKPFNQLLTTMTTETYTANLERWMFNYNRLLRPLELKILRGLNSCPTCSQSELVDKLKLRQPTISQVIKRLAEKHQLRPVSFTNFRVIGLEPFAVTFPVSDMRKTISLKNILSKIRYTLGIQEFDDALISYFAIPIRRITRFRQWVKQFVALHDLSVPEIRIRTERLQSRNFDLYNSNKGGWVTDSEAVLDNVSRLISGKWTQHLPPLNSFKLSPSSQRISIKPSDFIYMQRATDVYFITDRARFYEAEEARLAGYKETQHMAYRRRVNYLEKREVMSPPLGISIMHIGLNTIIHLLIESNEKETKRVLTALQLLPHIVGNIFNDGTGSASLLLPRESAISVQNALSQLFKDNNIPSIISIKPAWEAYGWTTEPIQIRNYDFDREDWVWTKDTLP